MRHFFLLLLFILSTASCAVPQFFIFLGAPGSGKGTQAALLSRKLKIPHISVGDLLRFEMKNKTALGLVAADYIDKGALVPDALVLEMLANRLHLEDCKEGAILDGTSRKLEQAEFLLNCLPEGRPLAIYFDLDTARLEDRILGRKVCSTCGASYHIQFHPEAVDGFCDQCKGNLEHRSDDTQQVLVQRLKIFDMNIKPVLNFYEQRGLLNTIRADDSIESVHLQISAIALMFDLSSQY